MSECMFPLYLVLVPFMTAFAAGALKLVWCEPRMVLYVAVGCVLWSFGLRGNERARQVMNYIRQGGTER